MKWFLAELQDESRERFRRTLSGEVSRSMTVHRRSRWQRTPMLHQLSDQELEEITPDNGWFIYSVVRHPSDRLWSAWQSKLLLREPRIIEKFPSAPWPRVPAATADVVNDFHEFIQALYNDPDQPIFKDRHFLPQAHLLRIETMPYSRIYRTSELPQFLEDLSRHLGPLGIEQMPELRRHNETPLPLIAPIFDRDTATIIDSYYAADLESFGYGGTNTTSSDARDEFTVSELAQVKALIERAERIGDLFSFAMASRQKELSMSSELNDLRRQISDLQAEIKTKRRSEKNRSVPSQISQAIMGASRRGIVRGRRFSRRIRSLSPGAE